MTPPHHGAADAAATYVALRSSLARPNAEAPLGDNRAHNRDDGAREQLERLGPRQLRRLVRRHAHAQCALQRLQLERLVRRRLALQFLSEHDAMAVNRADPELPHAPWLVRKRLSKLGA